MLYESISFNSPLKSDTLSNSLMPIMVSRLLLSLKKAFCPSRGATYSSRDNIRFGRRIERCAGAPEGESGVYELSTFASGVA